ncbi:tetratricopeptide repeat protein [Actomonas aquatica]|uniref:Tetratricopeptide repeat protein n=1 Tax=Actomonas aquatica TaxID=2866162 RepID=A0ABZ1C5Q1_9BACT|nr:hypothetical protein [Opitutus sp. WL0086]WRQ87059.1 hypothetical protein K1X11_019770 [Opitutus sp. WL0086]
MMMDVLAAVGGRSRGGRWIATMLIAVMVGVSAASAARDWIKLEAPDFVIMSDANEKTVREFAREMAGFHEAARQLFGRPGVGTSRSLIILHSRHKDFVAYGTREERDSRTRPFSFSTEVDGRAVTAVARGSNWRETRRIMAEFETIWLMRRYGWYLPIWMAQGSGSVVSTVEVEDDRVTIGQTMNHAQVIANNNLLPWSRFFDVGRSSPEYTGDKSPGVFHAQSWALMHWLLLQDDNGAARFATLGQRIAVLDGMQAVAEASGYLPEDWERKIRAHLRGRVPRRDLPFDAAAVEASFVVTPLAEAELLAWQSDIAAAAGRDAEADLRYLRALDLAPNEPYTLESGARWYWRRGEHASAIEKYQAAIEAGSQNAGAYISSAEWRVMRSSGNTDREGSGVPVVMEEAEREVRRALELDPGYGEAYQLLGRLAVLEREPDESKLELLSRRIGPDFWGIQARYYRGCLLDRLGREEEAQVDFDWIVHQAEASEHTQRNASNRLTRMRLEPLRAAVDEAMQAQDYATAWSALEDWEAEKLVPADEAEVRELKQHVSDVKKRAEQHELDRAVDRLNRMLKRAAFAEAQQEARRLAAKDVSDTMRDAYARLTRQVDEIATLQLMRLASKTERWAEVERLADEYLPTAPAEGKYREKIEALLAEAKAASVGTP